MHKCQKEDLIDVLVDDIKEIKQDVKSLLKFKWQSITILSVVISAAGYIVNLFISK